MTPTNIMLLKQLGVNDMTDGEVKQQDYEMDRREKVIALGINTAIHGLGNCALFSNKKLWPEQDQHLWEVISNDAHSILGDLMLLKMKLETILGAPAKEEE